MTSQTPRRLHDLLRRTASRMPAKQALVDEERSFSYRSFLERTESLARALRRRGITPGDRVAVLLPRSAEELFAFFAVSLAGGVFVPIPPRLRARQVRHILDDCEARLLVTTDRAIDGIFADGGALPERIDPCADLSREDLPAVSVAAEESTPSIDDAPETELAALLYTSGSTGLAKGVMISHANLLAGSRIVSRYLEITDKDRILCALPFSFDYGLNQAITAVDRGATSVLIDFRFGRELVERVEEQRITGLAGVPTLWALLVRSGLERRHLPHLRYITNSGGALPERTLGRLRSALPAAEIVLMYGLTEAFRSTYLPATELDRRPESIGRPIPETEIFVLAEDGTHCAPGEVGTLVHAGPTVSLGYWRRPEETAAILRPHPDPERRSADPQERVCWSGDLAYADAEGYLYFVGRSDAMIKTSGYRVSPTEIETALVATGQVAEAAVVGLPDPLLGERVHAVVVPSTPTLRTEELLDALSRELPEHMMPREVEIVRRLPTLGNGKVDYAGLRRDRLPKGMAS